MIRLRDIDRLLIVATLLLVAIGVVMVWSTSYIFAMKRYGDEYFFVKKHLTFALGGLILFTAAMRVPYTMYRKMVYPILLLAAAFLICIYIPRLGFSAGGARRWIRLGPVAFQPSEPAKLAVVVFLAYSLAAKAEKIKTFAVGFLPNILIPGVIIGLILLEPDLGTALTLSMIAGLMVFIGGVRFRYILALGAAALPV
ncbi:MAG: FtsW/RodA/SpoVE family cell cycle protein, partial [Deltaproteobacteria bacterium]